ncbi:hypothetical protein BC938DRAFT_481758, partial [Jimgerdemannia flammicorona]
MLWDIPLIFQFISHYYQRPISLNGCYGLRNIKIGKKSTGLYFLMNLDSISLNQIMNNMFFINLERNIMINIFYIV